METEEFDADAAFNQAAKEIESGGQTANSQPSAAETANQDTPDQREADTTDATPEQPKTGDVTEDALPEWLEDATDEVKENFRKLYADNKNLAHKERSQRGRVGALTKKWQQAKAALEQAKQSSGNYSQEMEELSVDYPELAASLSKILAGQAKGSDAISESIAQLAEASIEEHAQAELEESISLVTQLIPNAAEICASEEFQQWVNHQPKGIQAMFGSSDPNDAIYLLNAYQKTVSAKKATQEKRQKSIAAMTLPGGGHPKGEEEVDENALFDKVAAEIDRQIKR